MMASLLSCMIWEIRMQYREQIKRFMHEIDAICNEIEWRVRCCGVVSSVTFAVKCVCWRIFYMNIFSVMKRGTDGVPVPTVPENYSMRMMETVQDLDTLCVGIGKRTYQCFSKRLNNGQVCVAGFYKTMLVYYSWINFKQCRFVPLQTDEAYLYDAYTFPRHRKKGLHAYAFAMRLQYARQKGCTGVVIALQGAHSIVRHIVCDLFSFSSIGWGILLKGFCWEQWIFCVKRV